MTQGNDTAPQRARDSQADNTCASESNIRALAVERQKPHVPIEVAPDVLLQVKKNRFMRNCAKSIGLCNQKEHKSRQLQDNSFREQVTL